MKLICKFIVNTQNAIRSCLLALIFDPTTLIEIAVLEMSFSLELRSIHYLLWDQELNKLNVYYLSFIDSWCIFSIRDYSYRDIFIERKKRKL